MIGFSAGGKLFSQLGDPTQGDRPLASPLASLNLVKPAAINALSCPAPRSNLW